MNRFIKDDNGVLTDVTSTVNNYFSGTAILPFASAEDFWYIGSESPFNFQYFKLAGVNASGVSAIQLEYWGSNSWETAVDIRDETTNAAGIISMVGDGFVTWSIDRDESTWSRDDTEDMPGSGLESLKIYDMYWLRMSFAGDLSAFTSVQWIGQKFSEDAELEALYPFFAESDVKTAFQSGKTDWEAQAVMAAQFIEKDLIQRGVIDHRSQILRREELNLASVYKVAEIIFGGLGKDYEGDRLKAANEYDTQLKKGAFRTDRNKDGDLSNFEKRARVGVLTR